jgi:hypothetical protein
MCPENGCTYVKSCANLNLRDEPGDAFEVEPTGAKTKSDCPRDGKSSPGSEVEAPRHMLQISCVCHSNKYRPEALRAS